MTKNDYNLAVAYRIYPRISKTCVININDKFILAELCLKSFKESLDGIKAKIWALLDNCPIKYEDLFKKYFDKKDLKIIKLKGIGNYKTFNLQLKILIDQNDSEIVYFAEDDYFYLPNEFSKMISFLKQDPTCHFITPYDHLDFYKNSIFHNYKSYIKIFANHHWRLVNSSCATFLTTKKYLEKNKKVFKIYFKGKTILLSSWICLNKYKIFNPFSIIKLGSKQRMFYYFYYKAWRYGWKQILFGRKWNLWSPIPSIATHMEKKFLAPAIDWHFLFNKALSKIIK